MTDPTVLQQYALASSGLSLSDCEEVGEHLVAPWHDHGRDIIVINRDGSTAVYSEAMKEGVLSVLRSE